MPDFCVHGHIHVWYLVFMNSSKIFSSQVCTLPSPTSNQVCTLPSPTSNQVCTLPCPTFNQVCTLPSPTSNQVCTLPSPTSNQVCTLPSPTSNQVCTLPSPTSNQVCTLPSPTSNQVCTPRVQRLTRSVLTESKFTVEFRDKEDTLTTSFKKRRHSPLLIKSLPPLEIRS